MHTATPTEAGLLISLANSLPNPSSPLGRRARTLANRLQDPRASRAVHNAAADLTATLLRETDAGLPLGAEDGLLDDDFDL